MQNSNQFTEKVLNGFKACNVELTNSLVIGAAVSGGADSVALFLSLLELSKAIGFSLKVVTVNHFIREAEETTGDVNFVVDLCGEKGIECCVKELQPGEVKSLAAESKAGIEEAARELRYKCFEAFCNEQRIDYLCLAHNKNDQQETVLMRFLQGSGAEGLSGIAAVRGKYVRPMLNISRSEIEEYLEEKNQKYRTDSTNKDCNYLRNRIRNKLVPFLNEEFSGWDSGVLTVSQKAKSDEEFFQTEVQRFCTDNLTIENQTGCFSDLEKLSSLSYALFSRVILSACNAVSFEKRISGAFLQELYRWTQQKLASGNSSKIYGDLEFNREKAAGNKSEKKEVLIIKKQSKQIKDLCFSAIIEESGIFDLPEGKLLVETLENSKRITLCGKENLEYFVKVDFPFVVKNYTPGDETISADGKCKKLKDVFSDWKVPEADRQKIMILQELNSETQKILCIFGRVLGFKDWIVKS